MYIYAPALETAALTVSMIWLPAWLKVINVKPAAYILLQHYAR
jgi:hypothetical protein